MKFESFFKAGIIAWFAWLLVVVALWLGLIFTIIHFVKKFW